MRSRILRCNNVDEKYLFLTDIKSLIRKNKCSEVNKSILDGESLVLKHFQYWLETIYTSTILETFSVLSRVVWQRLPPNYQSCGILEMEEIILFHCVLTQAVYGNFPLAELIACLSLLGYQDVNHILLKFVNKVSY